ncbi:hypothetical protein [Roseateles sp. PN1]|uniref:hypothetical protein n=1 Tax=Roseateles sp. PN1 TaxID=3137372 RepID=UPI003138CC83
MFQQELNDLKLRHLALRLRSIELRAEMRKEAQTLTQPLGWWGLAGGAAGAAMLLKGRARRPGLARILSFVQLALRVANLFRQAKQQP